MSSPAKATLSTLGFRAIFIVDYRPTSLDAVLHLLDGTLLSGYLNYDRLIRKRMNMDSGVFMLNCTDYGVSVDGINF